MTFSGEDREPSFHDVREYLLGTLNEALRRPGMFGGELSLRIYLDAVAFTYGNPNFMRQEIPSLESRGLFLPTGVRGAFSQLWNTSADDQVASVYAEIAWRHGWLRPDRVLTAAEYDALAEVVTSWQGQDRSRSDVLAAFGPPSIGREGSPRWPKTLFYVTESAERPCVSFHFWNQPLPGGRAIYSESALLAIRFERPDFADSFTFTPLGRRYLLPTYA